MANDSDNMPLECQPRVKVPSPWRRCFETFFVIAALFGGGFGLGFTYASRVDDNDMARMREDHLAEIGRLQQAYGGRLDNLADRVSNATDTAQTAAVVAGSAAKDAQEAATTAAKAAKDAKK